MNLCAQRRKGERHVVMSDDIAQMLYKLAKQAMCLLFKKLVAHIHNSLFVFVVIERTFDTPYISYW